MKSIIDPYTLVWVSFEDGGRCHVEFSKVLFWTSGDPCIAYIIWTPNFVQICQELAEICPFVYFPRWRPSPSWISKKCCFGPLVTFVLPISMSIPNLVQIGLEMAKMHPFVYFPIWPPPPSSFSRKCYFGPHVTLVLAISIWNQIRCKSIKNWPRYAFFVFSMMTAATTLYLLFLHFGPPRMSPLPGSMFTANGKMISLNLSKTLRFYHFAILAGKCLFPPIFEGFEEFWPPNIMTSSF